MAANATFALKPGVLFLRVRFVIFAPDSRREPSPPSGRKSTQPTVQILEASSIRPTHLSFLHARNSNLREFEAFFGCPVEFGASGDQVAFSDETLALPLVTGDPHLLETLRPICDEAAKERGTAVGSLRAAVE